MVVMIVMVVVVMLWWLQLCYCGYVMVVTIFLQQNHM
jgi:hypothetical protein